MFVWSMKTTRPRLAVAGVILALLVVTVAVSTRQTAAVSVGGDDAKRVAYLEEQGYAVSPQWTDVREVTVPDAATIPSAYRGERIKCFTYVTQEGDAVYLYEYNGNIIGALPTAVG